MFNLITTLNHTPMHIFTYSNIIGIVSFSALSTKNPSDVIFAIDCADQE